MKLIVLAFLVVSVPALSQADSSAKVIVRQQKINLKVASMPLTLIAYGAFSQANEEMREFDTRVKGVVRRDPDFHTPVDNYLQYAPGVAVFALNAAGVHGKSNFRDRTMVFVMANLFMSATVESVKGLTKVPRPEGVGKNAFPSGHTATAFVGAEFLRQEYGDVSPLYGIAGYITATATGVLRMYNNMHWLRDVVAGAGFGILSTRVAYWLEPIVARRLFPRKYLKASPHSTY